MMQTHLRIKTVCKGTAFILNSQVFERHFLFLHFLREERNEDYRKPASGSRRIESAMPFPLTEQSLRSASGVVEVSKRQTGCSPKKGSCPI